MMNRRKLFVIALLAGVVLTACDSLLTDVIGVAEDEMAVSFALVDGNASAFEKVDRVALRFSRSDSTSRDTLVSVTVSEDGSIRVPLRLRARERIDSLGITAVLRAQSSPLFQGSAAVEVLPAEPNRVEIEIVPIPAGVTPDRTSLEFAARGESQQLAGYVLFETQDTISGLSPTWSSRDATVIEVSPEGLATGLSPGQTRLLFSYGTLSDSIPASVYPPVSSIQLSPQSLTLAVQDTTSIAAVSLSAQGDTLLERTLSWESADSLVVSVSQAGRLIARAAGATQILVTADDASSSIDVIVNEGGVIEWQLVGSPIWSDPANWGGALPGPSDTVVVAPDANTAISVDLNVSIASLTVGGGQGVVDLSASGVTLAVTAGIAVEAGSSLSLANSSVGGGITVGGQLDVTGGTVIVQGDLVGSSESTIAVGDASGGSVQLELLGAVTNAGVLSLGNSSGGGGGLLLSGGTLSNAEGGVVSVPAGSGASQISGLIENSGLVSVEGPLSLTSQGGNQVNSGTVEILPGGSLALSGADGFLNSGSVLATGGDATLAFSGAGSGFASADGSMEIQQTQSVTIVGGPVDLGIPIPGLAGPASVEGQGEESGTDLAAYALAGNGLLSLQQLTLVSPLIVEAGASAELSNVVAQGAVTVSGELSVLAGTGNAFSSGATVASGATLSVTSAADATSGTALTVTGALTNGGTLELTSQAAVGSSLTVSGGTLTNSVGGTLSVLVGAGGARTLQADTVTNAGSMSVATQLTTSTADAVWTNSGTLTVEAGGSWTATGVGSFSNGAESGIVDLSAGSASLTFSGTGEGFDNTTGAVSIGTSQTLAVSVGPFTDGGSITGAGTLELSDMTIGDLRVTSALATTLTNVTSVGTLTNEGTATASSSMLGTVVNTSGTLTLNAVAASGSVSANGGTVEVLAGTGNAFSSGATVASGATLSVTSAADATSGTALTVTGALTNGGTLELTSQAAVGSSLTVSGGTLTNSVGGTLSVLVGAGGARTLQADTVTNAGSMSVATQLTTSTADAVWTNSGTLTVEAGGSWTATGVGSFSNGAESGIVDLSAGSASLTFSGTGEGFDNTTGAVSIGTSQTLAVSVGPFTDGGSITGTGTLELSDMTIGDLRVTSALATTLTNVTLVGTLTNEGTATASSSMLGTVVNTSGTLTLNAVAASGSVSANGGTVEVLAGTGNAFSSGATVASGATLSVTSAADATSGTALTVTGALTNGGTLELTSQAAVGSSLTVSGGTLTNSVGGTLSVLVGAGGARTLQADTVTNAGSMSVATQLTTSTADAVWTNSGTLTVEAGGSWTATGVGSFSNGAESGIVDLSAGSASLTFSGTGEGFDNTTGAVSIGTSQTLAVSVGPFTDGGSITGTGTLELSDMTIGDLRVTSALATTLTNVTSVGTLTNEGTATASSSMLGTVVNTSGTLTLNAVAASGSVSANGGTVEVLAGTGNAFSSGATVASGATLSVTSAADATSGTALTVTGALTNGGTLELTSQAAVGSSLTVSGGTLTNSVGGTLSVLVGAGGARTLQADTVTNAGSMSVATQLTTSTADAVWTNSGTLTVTDSWTATDLDGFTNTGSLDLSAGSASLAFGVNATTGFDNGAEGTVSINGPTEIVGDFTNGGSISIAGTGSLTLSGGEGTHGNSGTITTDGPVSVTSNLSFTNSGTITAFADVSVTSIPDEPGPGTYTQTETGTLTLGADQVFSVTNGTLLDGGGALGQGGTVSLNSVNAQFVSGDALTLGSNGPNTLNLSGSSISSTSGVIVSPGAAGTWIDATVTGPTVNQGSLALSGTNTFNGTVLNDTGGVWDIQTGIGIFNGSLTNSGQFTSGADSLYVASALSNGGDLTFANSGLDEVEVDGMFQNLTGGTLSVESVTDGQLDIYSSLDILFGLMIVGQATSVHGDFRNRAEVQMAADLSVVNDLTTADLTAETRDWATAQVGAVFRNIGGSPVLTVPAMSFDSVTMVGVPLVLDRTAFGVADYAFIPNQATNLTFEGMGAQVQLSILEDQSSLDFSSILFDQTDPNPLYFRAEDSDPLDGNTLDINMNSSGSGVPTFDPGPDFYELLAGAVLNGWGPLGQGQ